MWLVEIEIVGHLTRPGREALHGIFDVLLFKQNEHVTFSRDDTMIYFTSQDKRVSRADTNGAEHNIFFSDKPRI